MGVPVILSLGKPVTAISQQGGKEAYRGNDGSLNTSFCPNGRFFPVWWRVDLGAAYLLTKTDTSFERNYNTYQYKIEVSLDDLSYTTVIDQTNNTTRKGTTLTDIFSAQARYVRITINAVLWSSDWGCFQELTVWGYRSVLGSGGATGNGGAMGSGGAVGTGGTAGRDGMADTDGEAGSDTATDADVPTDADAATEDVPVNQDLDTSAGGAGGSGGATGDGGASGTGGTEASGGASGTGGTEASGGASGTGGTTSEIDGSPEDDAGDTDCAGPTNLALDASAVAYRWCSNASSELNTNNYLAGELKDDDVSADISLNGSGDDAEGAWEAAGVVFEQAVTITSVEYVSGGVEGTTSTSGYFTGNFHLQLSADGATWTDATGWNLDPPYPNNGDASDQTFVFTGSASNVRGARVTGQVGTAGESGSWYARAREVRVWGTSAPP